MVKSMRGRSANMPDVFVRAVAPNTPAAPGTPAAVSTGMIRGRGSTANDSMHSLKKRRKGGQSDGTVADDAHAIVDIEDFCDNNDDFHNEIWAAQQETADPLPVAAGDWQGNEVAASELRKKLRKQVQEKTPAAVEEAQASAVLESAAPTEAEEAHASAPVGDAAPAGAALAEEPELVDDDDESDEPDDDNESDGPATAAAGLSDEQSAESDDGIIDDGARALVRDKMLKYQRQLRQIMDKSCMLSSRLKFSHHVQQLLDAVTKYHGYLLKTSARRQKIHDSESTTWKQVEKGAWVVPATGNSSIKITEGDQLAVARITAHMRTKGEHEFTRVDCLLFSEAEEKEMVDLEDAACWKRKQRRIKTLFCEDKSPFAFRGYIYRHNASASVGSYWNFFIKIPRCEASSSGGETARVISIIKALETEKILPKYLPRAMLRAFKDRYKHKFVGTANAGVLQELIDHVLGNDSKGAHGVRGRERRRRVELFLEQDEEDIEALATDLRRHNGSKEVYTRFYGILADYLQAEESKVDARRHQGASQIPTA